MFKLLSRPVLFFIISILIIGVAVSSYLYMQISSQQNTVQNQLTDSLAELANLKKQDQVLINQQLAEEIKNINQQYIKATQIFEGLNDLEALGIKTDKLDPLYANSLKYLADKNYASASASLTDLSTQIDKQKSDYKALPSAGNTTTQASPPPVNNTAPTGGYSRQTVQTETGSFTVSIISADLNSTRVIVDTASDSDCSNNCPALSVAEYVSRSGGFAGINGSFFCPPEYPSCAGKTNTFDTLLMNKKKTYFNSSNNVYSTIPLAVFSGSSARFISQSLEWGRDIGVDAVIANYPMLILNNQVVYGGSANEPKFNVRAAKGFIAEKGSTVYIGVVYGATMTEAAQVLKTLGVNSALNLDEGGSTALWYAGYKAGPGRNVPNAIVLIRR